MNRGRKGKRFQTFYPQQNGKLSNQQQFQSSYTQPPRQQFTLEIYGIAKDVSHKRFIKFINSSVAAPVTMRNLKRPGEKIEFQVNTEDEKNNILALNGRNMDGLYKLRIIETGQAVLQKQVLLMRYIDMKYNFEERILDLEGISSDQQLRTVGIIPDFQDANFCQILLDAIRFHTRGVVQLSLANNKIQTLRHLSDLYKAAPKLRMLALQYNSIQQLKELDYIRNCNITHLSLMGNPVNNKKDKLSYKNNINTIFNNRLQFLDGEDLPNILNLEQNPLPEQLLIGQQNDEERMRAAEFLQQYFKEYDENTPAHNRMNLIAAYDDNATFSLTFNKARDNQNRNQLSGQLSQIGAILPVGDKNGIYTTNSRNLLSIQDFKQRIQLLKKGPDEIISTLKHLPLSKHTISGIDIIPMDVPVQVSGGELPQYKNWSTMVLRFSGYFQEIGQQQMGNTEQVLRPFSRTFIIIQSVSLIPKAGIPRWPLVIASDHLTISSDLDWVQRTFEIKSQNEIKAQMN
ncbi:MAG: putative Nuclear RNA export factor 1 [Streblomastix strix]|uniref:Putative Nuclear RNA export factor 1 n=1 Tax=Streblomastix strix TaxID=222440 RepID=A0A5J4X7P5_9EUKA|nr:MAG: putative Nuclear RNA export factor 1 [Streblomastix strix]